MVLYLIGVVSSGLLFISEVLPFVNIPANGIFHTILTIAKHLKKSKEQVQEQVQEQGQTFLDSQSSKDSQVAVYITCECTKNYKVNVSSI